MYKRMINHNFVSVIMALFMVVSFSNIAVAEENFSHLHEFKRESLDQLIEVLAEDEHYDQEVAQQMIDRIDVFPERIIQELLTEGVKLFFIDFPLTELLEFEHLQGVVPRGWEHTGKTWDDVPGAGGLYTVARIGHSNPGKGHAAINLEYHELGHAIDYYLFDFKIHELNKFIQIHQEEKPILWPDGSFNADYMDNVEEYFAETLAMYYLGGEEKKTLKENALKTYEFIEHLPKRILSMESNNALGISFSWEKITDAVEYHIYRDDELIQTVTEPYFTDIQYENFQYYRYVVEALDESGNVINETFPKGVPANELGAPETPENFSGELTSSNTVSLKWDKVVNAVEYDVLRNNEVLTTVDSLNYIDEKITEGIEYNYSIIAKNQVGTSPATANVRIFVTADMDGEKDELKDEIVKVGGNRAEEMGNMENEDKQEIDVNLFIKIMVIVFILGTIVISFGMVGFLLWRKRMS